MPAKKRFPPTAVLTTAEKFLEHAKELSLDLPFESTVLPAPDGPLAETYMLKSGRRIGNRFCVLPMEGWDGTADGSPTERTARRWKNFGKSGAKLIWGGEAVAVRTDGKGNPKQLVLNSRTLRSIGDLRKVLAKTHGETYGTTEDLVIGLQLTHSGRFSRPSPEGTPRPIIAYHHPYLDPLFNIPRELPPISDTEIDDLVEDFVKAAGLAREGGFDFVDIKHCHGYLGHELLSAVRRKGRYGGSFENRTRFLREIIGGIRRDCPGLDIGVRISAYDAPPYRAEGPGGPGRCLYSPEDGPYPYAFGGDSVAPPGIDPAEPIALLEMLRDLSVELICMSAGSPYYTPHLQRPAVLPPSDGYYPPEDPLIATARQIDSAALLKNHFPDLAVVGSGYSYLRQWIPNIAQGIIRKGMADFIGLGRMIFAYPKMPADILAGTSPDTKRLCAACSTCTTAARKGLVSGCYLFDPEYRGRRDALEKEKS